MHAQHELCCENLEAAMVSSPSSSSLAASSAEAAGHMLYDVVMFGFENHCNSTLAWQLR
jgi:hypothetical protein